MPFRTLFVQFRISVWPYMVSSLPARIFLIARNEYKNEHDEKSLKKAYRRKLIEKHNKNNNVGIAV